MKYLGVPATRWETEKARHGLLELTFFVPTSFRFLLATIRFNSLTFDFAGNQTAVTDLALCIQFPQTNPGLSKQGIRQSLLIPWLSLNLSLTT